MKRRLSMERRRQIDSLLQSCNCSVLAPATGWMTEIRRAFGLTKVQVAAKLGVSPTTVADLERSEACGTISLNSLRRVADAMDCTLVYAVVPRAGSIESQLRQRAQLVAREIVKNVSHTMSLESQLPEPENVQQQIDDLADELVFTLSPELWKDYK